MKRLLAACLALAAAAPLPARSALEGLEGLAMPPAASRRVQAREGGLAICTDGRVRDASRARRLRRHDSDHQQRTALTAGGRMLDPDAVPYFVLPAGFPGAALGDLALVSYGGRSAWAVAGDSGPCEGCLVGAPKHKHPYAFGEGSVALARALRVPGFENGDRGGVAEGVSYLIFPGTAPKDGFESQAQLLRFVQETGQALYRRRFAAPRAPPAS